MRLSFLPVFLAVPLLVVACEGDCITNTTKAMVHHYNSPVELSLTNIGQEIRDKLLPGSTVTPLSLMKPIMTQYRNICFENLRFAVFPSHFHGKCLDDEGHEPEGCPDPDCPMVCGTPGSMVHFYDDFARISFAATNASLMSSAAPDSDSYLALEKRVTTLSRPRLGTAPGPRILRYRRLFDILGNDELSASPVAQNNVALSLRSIVAKLPDELEKSCGGPDIPRCLWEKPMKEYILSFP
ncbi:hypothetical protein C8R45DRAFT_166761 [Mycena sanguinolenta]|nr:hypothetical protein C8R45DRAFT_166761 [Mycena sanguinolenta]